MDKKNLSSFNHPDTLLVISSFPIKGEVHGARVGGLASFSKNTLKTLVPVWPGKIVVLAESLDGKKEIYQEEGMLVVRCWRRNSLSLYFSLLKYILQLNKVKILKVQFEFSVFGDLAVTGIFPLFLFLLRILGKEICLVVHQVLTDLTSLFGHLGMEENSLKLYIFSKLNCLYYVLLSLGAKSIVVLEEEFKKRMEELGIKKEKIFAIPHGVDCSIKAISSLKAKEALNIKSSEFVVLVFGFLNWYKGSDLMVRAFNKYLKENKDHNIRLIMAGGESVTQKNRSHYQRFIKKLYSIVRRNPQITITGFIPESKISLYFSAADLMILPYRTFMSSSGVLSLALSYQKPFLTSSALKKWFKDEYQNKLIFFYPDLKSLTEALRTARERKENFSRLIKICKELRSSRDFVTLAEKYKEILYSHRPSVATLSLKSIKFSLNK